MRDAERLEIGHDARGIVEAEVLASAAGDRWRAAHATALPRLDRGIHRPRRQLSRRRAAPDRLAGLERIGPRLRPAAEIGQERQRFAACRTPIARSARRPSNSAVPWPGRSCGRRGMTNVLRAASSRCTRSSRAAMRRPVDRRPIERGQTHGLLRQRIGHVVAVLRVGLGEFLSPAVADRVGELALEIAEERKRPPRAPFVAHEHQRRRRREQRDGKRRLQRRRLAPAPTAARRARGCRSGRGSAGN